MLLRKREKVQVLPFKINIVRGPGPRYKTQSLTRGLKMKQWTKISIPEEVRFSDLKLSRNAGGNVEFDWSPIEVICRESGIPIDPFCAGKGRGFLRQAQDGSPQTRILHQCLIFFLGLHVRKSISLFRLKHYEITLTSILSPQGRGSKNPFSPGGRRLG